MNKFKRITTVSLCFAMLTSTGAFAEMDENEKMIREESFPTKTIDAKVIVNENNVMHELDNYNLSVQCESFDAGTIFLEGETQELSAKFKDFADKLYDYPVFRLGGGSAEVTNMIRNVGPMGNRTSSENTLDGFNNWYYGTGQSAAGAAHRVGPLELVKIMECINKDAEFLPCISMNAATPEDNANLARFLLDKPGESEWGTLRATLGHPEPVKVYAFELGNEIDHGGSLGWGFWQAKLDWYGPLAKKHIDAIRAVAPEAKFMACGKTAAWNDLPDWGIREDWRKWTVGVMQAIGKDVDYLSFHCYYDGYTMNYMDYFFQAQKMDIDSVLGPDNNVKVVVTEHARWADPNSYNKKAPMLSLSGALSTAQYFNRIHTYPYIVCSTYHNFISSGQLWSQFQNIDGKYMETVVGKMFHVYGKGIGDRVIESHVESDSLSTDITSSQMRFTVLASPKGKRELNLILNNDKEEEDYNLTFDFKNQYTLTEETVFTAPNINSYVYNSATENIATTTVTQKNEKNFTTYHMPAKSLVILKLVSNKDIPMVGESAGGAGGEDDFVENVETVFTDIGSSWAKNEIATLNSLGYVSGVSETEFDPKSNVTRAEFAAIIARMFDYDSDYSSSVFDDVAIDDWYGQAVNAAYFAGAVKGKTEKMFMPNDPITLEEAAIVVNRLYKNANPGDTSAINLNVMRNINNKSDISPWAINDIAYSINKGLLYRLYENGHFDASANATREQIASILYRLYRATV